MTSDQGKQLKSTSPIGSLMTQFLSNWFRRDSRRERFEFYDPLAFAVALQPQLIDKRQVTLEVETIDPSRLGETRVAAEGGPVTVAKNVDAPQFFGLMRDLFQIRT